VSSGPLALAQPPAVDRKHAETLRGRRVREQAYDSSAMGPGFATQPLDLMVLALFAFLVLGPNRFPGVARSFGRWLREARTAFSSLAVNHTSDQAETLPAPEANPTPTAYSDSGGDDTSVAAEGPSTRYRELDRIG
jgi:Sec-independent protein translocase protein TatA